MRSRVALNVFTGGFDLRVAKWHQARDSTTLSEWSGNARNKELKTLQGPDVRAAAGLPYRYALAVRRRNCPAHFLLRVLQHGNGLAVQIHLQESLDAGRIGSTHPQVATVRSPIDGGDPHPPVEGDRARFSRVHRENLNFAGHLTQPPRGDGQH